MVAATGAHSRQHHERYSKLRHKHACLLRHTLGCSKLDFTRISWPHFWTLVLNPDLFVAQVLNPDLAVGA